MKNLLLIFLMLATACKPSSELPTSSDRKTIKDDHFSNLELKLGSRISVNDVWLDKDSQEIPSLLLNLFHIPKAYGVQVNAIPGNFSLALATEPKDLLLSGSIETGWWKQDPNFIVILKRLENLREWQIIASISIEGSHFANWSFINLDMDQCPEIAWREDYSGNQATDAWLVIYRNQGGVYRKVGEFLQTRGTSHGGTYFANRFQFVQNAYAPGPITLSVRTPYPGCVPAQYAEYIRRFPPRPPSHLLYTFRGDSYVPVDPKGQTAMMKFADFLYSAAPESPDLSQSCETP